MNKSFFLSLLVLSLTLAEEAIFYPTQFAFSNVHVGEHFRFHGFLILSETGILLNFCQEHLEYTKFFKDRLDSYFLLNTDGSSLFLIDPNLFLLDSMIEEEQGAIHSLVYPLKSSTKKGFSLKLEFLRGGSFDLDSSILNDRLFEMQNSGWKSKDFIQLPSSTIGEIQARCFDQETFENFYKNEL